MNAVKRLLKTIWGYFQNWVDPCENETTELAIVKGVGAFRLDIWGLNLRNIHFRDIKGARFIYCDRRSGDVVRLGSDKDENYARLINRDSSLYAIFDIKKLSYL